MLEYQIVFERNLKNYFNKKEHKEKFRENQKNIYLICPRDISKSKFVISVYVYYYFLYFLQCFVFFSLFSCSPRTGVWEPIE